MNHDEMSEEEDIEIDEEFYEAIKILVMSVQVVIHMVNELRVIEAGRQIEHPLNPCRINNAFGYKYIHRALNDDPAIFQKVYRMYPDVFRKCNILREKTHLEDTMFICVEEMLGQFLQIVGQNHCYCVIRNNFRRSQFATSEVFRKMLKTLNTLSKDMMTKPGLVVPAKIRENTKFFPYFKNCIGAIDGTHIPATMMRHNNSSFRGRHGNISQNILAACNFDLEFMYVLAGWEGSTHDFKLLNDDLSMRNGLKVPQGKYFVADCGFANRRQFLAPYRGVCYHLQDFAGNGNDSENEKELFNLRHASLRNVIERIFGSFKSRFTFFKSAPPFPFKTQVEIVLACVALHNFLRKECRSDGFPIEEESTSSSSSIVEEELEELVSQT
ncbi:hypothetical protein Ddye_005050 [Dipteronia dyeriana]|uniref:DDE Tnp4 domain-containing protein n=1 Tax=Dipteronia dyeriana TaxID=168575 RepID=A0AAD9XFY5_9ROSI|nr:hypothetical protein Ddye_005050 [Dipteronia dyeriana]